MVAGTQAGEPGTLFYEWSLSADGRQCHLFERYADSDAAMVHLGNFQFKYAERFLAILRPVRFSVYGAPNAAVREALAGFGAEIYTMAGGFAR